MPKPNGSIPQLPVLSSTPSANPAAGTHLLYMKNDGSLYSKSSAGVETPVGAGVAADEEIFVQTSQPVGVDGDLWVDPDASPGSTASYLHVGPGEPTFAGMGIWVQTGLGPSGTDWTIWIEDGT